MTPSKSENSIISSNKDQGANVTLNRRQRYFIIWTVIFGVSLAIGGSALEPFPIPFLGITAASPLVALMVTLNKLVIRSPLSVTAMYCVVTVLAVFTSYLGPPSILKPIFVLAAFSFDAATLFQTRQIRFWHLALGHLAITITGFAAFWVLIRIHVPASAAVVGRALLYAAPVYYVQAIVVAALVYRAFPLSNPPAFLRRIQGQLGAVDNV